MYARKQREPVFNPTCNPVRAAGSPGEAETQPLTHQYQATSSRQPVDDTVHLILQGLRHGHHHLALGDRRCVALCVLVFDVSFAQCIQGFLDLDRGDAVFSTSLKKPRASPS